jgi:hypothetical protein
VRIALLAEAEAELKHAAAWYDERSDGLGDELLDVAREAMLLIRETTETWPFWPGAPARVPPIRRFLLPRFPYALAYQVFPDFSSCSRWSTRSESRSIGSAERHDRPRQRTQGPP